LNSNLQDLNLYSDPKYGKAGFITTSVYLFDCQFDALLTSNGDYQPTLISENSFVKVYITVIVL